MGSKVVWLVAFLTRFAVSLAQSGPIFIVFSVLQVPTAETSEGLCWFVQVCLCLGFDVFSKVLISESRPNNMVGIFFKVWKVLIGADLCAHGHALFHCWSGWLFHFASAKTFGTRASWGGGKTMLVLPVH